MFPYNCIIFLSIKNVINQNIEVCQPYKKIYRKKKTVTHTAKPHITLILMQPCYRTVYTSKLHLYYQTNDCYHPFKPKKNIMV